MTASDRNSSRWGHKRLRKVEQLEPQKVSRTESAYTLLKGMILSGELGPANLIDANSLTDTLGVGRTPVREALQRLQTEGIVRIIPKRGVQIVMLTADELMEIYQVISALELEAVLLLADCPDNSAALSDLMFKADDMIPAAQSDDRDRWVLGDEAFHRAILEHNPNQRLRDAGLLHRDLVQRAHFVALRLLDPSKLLSSAQEHKQMVTLLASGNTKEAVENHRQQRARGAEMLVGVVRQYRLTQL